MESCPQTSFRMVKSREEKRSATDVGEIYGWFIEGFDIEDLQEAKALLQELA